MYQRKGGFLLQTGDEIIQIERAQVFCFAAYGHLPVFFFAVAHHDLIGKALLAVVADFIADFLITQIQCHTEAFSAQTLGQSCGQTLRTCLGRSL